VKSRAVAGSALGVGAEVGVDGGAPAALGVVADFGVGGPPPGVIG